MNTINEKSALIKSSRSNPFLLVLTSFFLLLFMVFSTLAYAGPENRPPMPSISLPDNAHGKAAVDALGRQISEVAAHYGMSAEELRETLLRDKTLWVDKKGRLFYVEEALNASTDTSTTPQTGEIVSNIPTSQAFSLHSLPGAKKVIYLDFNGHVATNTWWNMSVNKDTITSRPYDHDGNPAVFSDSERAVIIYIWKSVAEDYAPFGIDVTTEDPGAEALIKSSPTDTAYGVRVVIGGASYDWLLSNTGGIAYISGFGDVDGSPAYVFPINLNFELKALSEATAHEAGHTFGLRHWGTTSSEYYAGQGVYPTDWAPIMGVGTSKTVTQWSKGEYQDAYKPYGSFDDIQSILVNGAPFRNDDIGNDLANAKLATMVVDSADPTKANVNMAGVIERDGDVDMLALQMGAGPASITVSTEEINPNLDINVAILDVAGNQLASANNPGTGAETISVNVPMQGIYYLSITNSGAGDPRTNGYSSYGSLGQYTVKASVPKTDSALPVAVAKATPTAGLTPLTVAFDAASSADPDGSIIGYAWKFGNGATSTQPNPSHTYTSPGKYTATLTVTDNAGLKASSDVNVTVKPLYVYVDSIVMTTAAKGAGTIATATVTIKNYKGALVDGTVTGYWSGLYKGPAGSVAARKGVAKFSTTSVTGTGTFYFYVSDVIVTGLTYYPDENKESQDSINR